MASGVSSGIRRKVDDLGRVVIPAGIRRTLSIREGDAVEVSVDGERVVLSKPRDACVFCGREGDDLHPFRGRLLCRECVTTIGQVDDRLRAAAASDANDPSDATDASHATDAAALPTPPRSVPPATTRAADPAPSPNEAAPSPVEPPATVPPRSSAPNAAPTTAAPTASTPPERPASWPAGPIDGDAFAREQARRAAAAVDAEAADAADADDADDPPQHGDDRASSPPAYDPASTTAW